jgi:acetyl-CoA synthetase
MIPEAAAAMLACARIGAIHSIVFGGFSPDSLAGRIQDCDSRLVITADEGWRGGKRVPLKANVDKALESCPGVDKVLVVRRTGGGPGLRQGRDVDYAEALAAQSEDCPPEPNERGRPALHPLHSGSTGKPKGVLHTTGRLSRLGFDTHQYLFDYRPGEVFWCTADVAGSRAFLCRLRPLANGATSLMFEGRAQPSLISAALGGRRQASRSTSSTRRRRRSGR